MNRHVLTAAAFFAILAAARTPAQEPLVQKPDLDLTRIRRLPVLEGERYKPLDSLAREWVERITGKQTFRDTDPVLLFLHWRLEPELARKEPLIRLPKAAATEALGYDPSMERTHVSWDELDGNAEFKKLVASARLKPQEQLSSLETEILNLNHRWGTFGSFAGLHEGWETSDAGLGGWLPIIPPAQPPVPGVVYQWLSPAHVADAAQPMAGHLAVMQAMRALRQAFIANDGRAFDAASAEVLQATAKLGYPEGEEGFPGMARMDREIRFNAAKPFARTWPFYFGSFLLALISMLVRGKRWPSRLLWIVAMIPALVGLGIHAWGLFERTTLSGRAMIGTFYESLLFSAGVAVIGGLIFELIFRNRFFLLAGSLLGVFGLWVATKNPDFMQPAISNLRPVLINNDWIHIHVPTIMASYAILGLAAILGNIWLIRYVFRGENDPSQKSMLRTMFWTVPVGETLLFAGIILGGIWADASWGRFWGWDPKEIGALIMWLVFLVVIHGRWAGWLRDFGTAVGFWVGGWSLLWSYYGTNFFWTGLHSYAGASSDKEIPAWMFAFTVIEGLIFGAALVARHIRSSGGGHATLPTGPEGSAAVIESANGSSVVTPARDPVEVGGRR